MKLTFKTLSVFALAFFFLTNCVNTDSKDPEAEKEETEKEAPARVAAPQPSPSSTIEQVVGLTDVTLEYSRPGMRGRKIFGDLVPFGTVWRTG